MSLKNEIDEALHAYKSYTKPPSSIRSQDVASYIDHTLLKLDATESQVDQLCIEAKKYNFATVCVRLNYVERAVSNLQGSSVGVACVVGFHEGNHATGSKTAEAKQAVQDGASELDMVINYELLKQKDYDAVFEDVKAVREAAPAPTGLKCILETSQLSFEEIIAATIVCARAGADFVKTSTGFNGRGAIEEDVHLMNYGLRRYSTVKIKASGGVRSLEALEVMAAAGASRIGTSSGVAIMEETSKDFKQPPSVLDNTGKGGY
ncbi:MAG: hypothetical protein M4579_003157 [Chaenotheca gracillima]|nr:MAG: hypothetical protein M4579_003157 [Chaenotheca gracillima]